MRLQPPGLGARTVCIGEATDGDVDGTTVVDGVRGGGPDYGAGGAGAGEAESKESSGDPAAAMGTWSAVPTREADIGKTLPTPAGLTVGFGLGRFPAASNWCGYTPRPERLLRPEDLGPPLLPDVVGWAPVAWSGAGFGIPTGRERL